MNTVSNKVAKWRDGTPSFISKHDAGKISTEIDSICYNTGKKTCEADELLDYARNHTASESHKCFDWNDSSAAEKYRKKQANDIISHIQIEVPSIHPAKPPKNPKTKPIEIKAYHHISGQKGYKPVEIIMQNTSDYNKLVQQAYSELKRIKNKYQGIKELQKIFSLIP